MKNKTTQAATSHKISLSELSVCNVKSKKQTIASVGMCVYVKAVSGEEMDEGFCHGYRCRFSTCSFELCDNYI